MTQKERKRAILLFVSILFVYTILFLEAPLSFSKGNKSEGRFVLANLRPFETAGPQGEWRVPNVTDLPMKSAISRVLPYTRNLRIFGSGRVIRQYPRAFERVKGEVQFVMYGEKQNEAH